MRALFIGLAVLIACSGGGGGSPAPSGSGGTGGGPAGPPAGTNPPAAGPAGGGDWGQYRGSVRGTSSSPGTWDVSDAPAIAPLWTQDLGSFGYSQPTIAGDAVYVAMAFSDHVAALDLRAGRGPTSTRTSARPAEASCVQDSGRRPPSRETQCTSPRRTATSTRCARRTARPSGRARSRTAALQVTASSSSRARPSRRFSASSISGWPRPTIATRWPGASSQSI